MPRFATLIAAFVSVFIAAPSLMAAPVLTLSPKTLHGSDIHLVAQGDYVCEAKLFGKRARLWLKGDTPATYKWHTNSKRAAKMQGNTIRIQASPMATISNVVMGENSSGQKTVTGDFKFKSNEKDGLVFTCTPG